MDTEGKEMKLLAHVMPWFGDGNIHRMNSYLSNDPYVIARQLDVMQKTKINGSSIDGVILTWQGPLAPFQHSTAEQMVVQCGERGLLFALLMDPWIAKIGTGTPTQLVTNALNDPTTQAIINAPAYLPEKYVLDFTTGADLATLGTMFPTLKFLAQKQGFSWPDWNSALPNSGQQNAWCISDLQSQNASAAMKIPAVFRGFNDAGQPTPVGVALSAWTGTRNYSESVWGGNPARVLDTQGGSLFFDSWDAIPKSAGYAAFVTWNDYDEGTEIESAAAMFAGVNITGAP